MLVGAVCNAQVGELEEIVSTSVAFCSPPPPTAMQAHEPEEPVHDTPLSASVPERPAVRGDQPVTPPVVVCEVNASAEEEPEFEVTPTTMHNEVRKLFPPRQEMPSG